MADQSEKQADTEVKLPDPVEYSKSMAKIAERSQQLVRDFLERQASDTERRRVVTPEAFDPLNVGGAFLAIARSMMANPARLVQAQVSLWSDSIPLWRSGVRRWRKRVVCNGIA